MATVSNTSVYAKGFLVGSDKDWFHGELSTVQANHALSASHKDCFLVRVDQGAIILSISHHGQLHHTNINYGPGWYELESGSAQYSFTELEELVSYYSETTISDDLKFTLGVVCIKKGVKFPLYETISDPPQSNRVAFSNAASYFDGYNTYSKGEPEDLVRYKWYHGLMCEDLAEVTLLNQKCNSFLVRYSSDKLVLSKKDRGYRFHTIIQRSPEGYQLEGDGKLFLTVSDLIDFHQNSLGTPAETLPAGLPELISPSNPRQTFKKEAKILRVNWKRCADLPVALSAPHVVKIGEDVYVGGGLVDDKATMDDCVFKYDCRKNNWALLPSCRTVHYGLTTLNSELIAVGGRTIDRWQETNVIRTFRNGKWKKVLPPMPTPRWSLATVSHDNKIIIAAGGVTMLRSNGESVPTNTIEIYTTDKRVWYTATKFPFTLVQFQTCIVTDACYTLGGTPSTNDKSATVLYATMSSFLENADNTTTWKQLQDNPLIYSTPVELAGRLVAVGGSAELRLRRGTRFVSTYDFATDTWVECKGAALPTPLYRPGVLKLDDSRVMIVGGQPKTQQFSAAVYIGNYKMM